MGERTQILVNVHLSDEKCPFGTVIHYQWGAGITMLLDAISVIRSLPSPYMLKYDDDDEDKFKYLDSILKSQDFEIRNPQVYRNLYKHILNGVQHGSSNERRDTFKFLSFEDFCNQPAYKCSCNEDFQAGYKLLLRSIGCTFMNAEDQNRILAIKRQQNLINC